MYRLGNFCLFLILLPLLAALWVEGVLFLGPLPNPQALLWVGVGMVGMFLLCVFLQGTTFYEVCHENMAFECGVTDRRTLLGHDACDRYED